MRKFSVGEKVKFSRDFLRNTGQYTGDVPFARGIVQEVSDLVDMQLVTVQWDTLGVSKALASNLTLASNTEV